MRCRYDIAVKLFQLLKTYTVSASPNHFNTKHLIADMRNCLDELDAIEDAIQGVGQRKVETPDTISQILSELREQQSLVIEQVLSFKFYVAKDAVPQITRTFKKLRHTQGAMVIRTKRLERAINSLGELVNYENNKLMEDASDEDKEETK